MSTVGDDNTRNYVGVKVEGLRNLRRGDSSGTCTIPSLSMLVFTVFMITIY